MPSDNGRPDPLVTVVFDDPARRAEIEHVLLGETLELLPEGSDLGGQAPEPSGEGRAHVLVTAGELSNRSRRSLVGSLRARFSPETKIVVCAEQVDRHELRQAIEQGIDGLVLARDIGTVLAPTIRAVAVGQLVIPRELRRRLEQPSLSVREKQVLSLVVMGLSNGEIARRLFIGQTTVKSHLGSAFRKLGVGSRAEAARLITDPDEGLGTGILRITGPAAPDPDRTSASVAGDPASAAPRAQPAGKTAEQPDDSPDVCGSEP